MLILLPFTIDLAEKSDAVVIDEDTCGRQRLSRDNDRLAAQ
ncbi:hypothetical protein ACVWZ3_007156 [Bradyrhizobium sp. i1.3.6]